MSTPGGHGVRRRPPAPGHLMSLRGDLVESRHQLDMPSRRNARSAPPYVWTRWTSSAWRKHPIS